MAAWWAFANGIRPDAAGDSEEQRRQTGDRKGAGLAESRAAGPWALADRQRTARERGLMAMAGSVVGGDVQ